MAAGQHHTLKPLVGNVGDMVFASGEYPKHNLVTVHDNPFLNPTPVHKVDGLGTEKAQDFKRKRCSSPIHRTYELLLSLSIQHGAAITP